MMRSAYLYETTLAMLALNRHTPFWNQDDPRIENLPFTFGLEAQLALSRRDIQL